MELKKVNYNNDSINQQQHLKDTCIPALLIMQLYLFPGAFAIKPDNFGRLHENPSFTHNEVMPRQATV